MEAPLLPLQRQSRIHLPLHNWHVGSDLPSEAAVDTGGSFRVCTFITAAIIAPTEVGASRHYPGFLKTKVNSPTSKQAPLFII